MLTHIVNILLYWHILVHIVNVLLCWHILLIYYYIDTYCYSIVILVHIVNVLLCWHILLMYYYVDTYYYSIVILVHIVNVLLLQYYVCCFHYSILQENNYPNLESSFQYVINIIFVYKYEHRDVAMTYYTCISNVNCNCPLSDYIAISNCKRLYDM